MSASMMPTLLPHLASAIARFTATVVCRRRLAGPDSDDVLDGRHRLPRAVGAHGLTHARAQLHVDRATPDFMTARRLIATLIFDRTRGVVSSIVKATRLHRS